MSRYFELVAGSALIPGVFHLVPRIDNARLEEIFAREVLAFLVRKELLSPDKWPDKWKLTFAADRPPPPQVAYQELLMAAETSIEYFS